MKLWLAVILVVVVVVLPVPFTIVSFSLFIDPLRKIRILYLGKATQTARAVLAVYVMLTRLSFVMQWRIGSIKRDVGI